MENSNDLLDPSFALKKQGGGKGPLLVVVVILSGIIGFLVFRTLKANDERKLHATFMGSFADVEKNDVGKFWACILGPNVDPGMFPSNIALSQRIEGAFGADLKSYPSK